MCFEYNNRGNCCYQFVFCLFGVVVGCFDGGGGADLFLFWNWILTSSGWARSSRCLTWYLTLLRDFDYITRSKFILNGANAKRYAKSCFRWIIFSSIIIRIEKLFKPLQKFKIILESALYQFIHRYNLVLCALVVGWWRFYIKRTKK